MQFLKNSSRQTPKISLVLIDWSVRESFHILHYLKNQTIPRDQFEVLIVEYYSRVSPAVEKFADMVDSWILAGMPESSYYHKHLMYNIGIVNAKGEIVIICDSDAMVKPTFLQSILDEFAKNENLVLHLDQFRNNRRDLYPFCYPDFDTVMGEGCINNQFGKTKGLAVKEDVLHHRNYGACFCAKRSDLIAIGGADEHIDYVGHICGPYDMTFRLTNYGKKELWHDSEFLFHTWHPGQAGQDNFFGPHDGFHMSTTSLEAMVIKQIQPHVINPGIAQLQKNISANMDALIPELVRPENKEITKRSFLKSHQARHWAKKTYKWFMHKGYIILASEKYYANSLYHYNHQSLQLSEENFVKQAEFIADSFNEMKKLIAKKNELNKPFLYLSFGLTCMLKLGGAFLRGVKRFIKAFSFVTDLKSLLRTSQNITSSLKQTSTQFPGKTIWLVVDSGKEKILITLLFKFFHFKNTKKVILKEKDSNILEECLKNLDSPDNFFIVTRQIYINFSEWFMHMKQPLPNIIFI